MGLLAETIVHGARRTLGYAERMLKDVRPEQFARKAAPGGTPVDSNHPAFVYGHLALYPARIIALTGGDPASVAVSPAWEPLFKNGAACLDDPAGTIYPLMTEIAASFMSGYEAAIAAVRRTGDDRFALAMPDERMREFLPTAGAGCLFLLNNHVMVHLGQISAWRRMMGLGAA